MNLLIPEDVSCVPTYFVGALASIASAIIVYLIKKLNQKEKVARENIVSYLNDLKEQRIIIHNIYDKKTDLVLNDYDKKTDLVLSKIESQITKLEFILNNLNTK